MRHSGGRTERGLAGGSSLCIDSPRKYSPSRANRAANGARGMRGCGCTGCETGKRPSSPYGVSVARTFPPPSPASAAVVPYRLEGTSFTGTTAVVTTLIREQTRNDVTRLDSRDRVIVPRRRWHTLRSCDSRGRISAISGAGSSSATCVGWFCFFIFRAEMMQIA